MEEQEVQPKVRGRSLSTILEPVPSGAELELSLPDVRPPSSLISSGAKRPLLSTTRAVGSPKAFKAGPRRASITEGFKPRGWEVSLPSIERSKEWASDRRRRNSVEGVRPYMLPAEARGRRRASVVEVLSSDGTRPTESDPTGLNSKVAGDEALQHGFFEEAVTHYTSALGALNHTEATQQQTPQEARCIQGEQTVPVEAVEHKAALFAIYAQRSCALSNMREFKYAYADAKHCIQLDAKNPCGHARKGYALEGLRKNAKAVEAYQMALKLDPTNPGLLKKLTEIRFKANASKYGYSGGRTF